MTTHHDDFLKVLWNRVTYLKTVESEIWDDSTKNQYSITSDPPKKFGRHDRDTRCQACRCRKMGTRMADVPQMPFLVLLLGGGVGGDGQGRADTARLPILIFAYGLHSLRIRHMLESAVVVKFTYGRAPRKQQ